MTVRRFLLVVALAVGIGLVGLVSRPGPDTPLPRPSAPAPVRSRSSPRAAEVPEPSTGSQAIADVHTLAPELAAFLADPHEAEARRLEAAYRDVMAFGGDPRATVLALLAVGDCKDALGDDASARDAWDRAETFARELGPDPEIAALLADRRP